MGIEALSALGEDERERLTDGQWRAVWGMRNRLTHAYLAADQKIVDDTVRAAIPALVERLEATLNG